MNGLSDEALAAIREAVAARPADWPGLTEAQKRALTPVLAPQPERDDEPRTAA